MKTTASVATKRQILIRIGIAFGVFVLLAGLAGLYFAAMVFDAASNAKG